MERRKEDRSQGFTLSWAQRRMLKTDKTYERDREKGEGGNTFEDEPLPSLTSPEERKNSGHMPGTVLGTFHKTSYFILPNTPQERYYYPQVIDARLWLREPNGLPRGASGGQAKTPGLQSQQRWLAGPQPWPQEPAQRPKLCSEQSLFKQSLTGNLAPLTHSDSTLLRNKKEQQEPALGRVSRQELAPRQRPAEHNSLCPDLPTAPKP